VGHQEINTGHLLLGLLDAGHAAVLPDGLDPEEIRRKVLDLLGPGAPPEDDLPGRLHRLAARLRSTDPEAASELDEVADQQRVGLDRVVEMVRAWRGEIFLEAVARDATAVRLLGARRLGVRTAETPDDTYSAPISSPWHNTPSSPQPTNWSWRRPSGPTQRFLPPRTAGA